MIVTFVYQKLASKALNVVKIVARRKTQEEEGDQGGTGAEGQLAKVLGLGDLTLLGVGSTLGLGVYELAGAVARTDAGPAVILSFLIAAIASAFAGLCYAEFAARVPKAGSAYVYSYVTVGELCAFIIGWNLILEYIIGAASVARGLSNYVDSLMGKTMSSALTKAMPIGVSWLSPYPDFLSAVMLLIISCLIAWGVKESTLLNNLFTTVNLLTVGLVIVVGAFYVDISNWSLDAASAPAVDGEGTAVTPGRGGFLPFGVTGVMAGAAKCFYGFVGFDCVATTGEEARNPKRDIPLAIIISLVIILLAYFGTACVLTLMWPYYLQDEDAPLPNVFEQKGLPVVKWVVSIGAVFALCTNILGALFPLPRVVYSMAVDRLLFSPLAYINPRTHTPITAILVGGLISGVMACIFNLDQLIDMMSIGTLLAYTIVAICVLIIRYRVPHSEVVERGPKTASSFGDILNFSRTLNPNKMSEGVASSMLAAYVMSAAVLCVALENLEDALTEGHSWAYTVIGLFVVMLLTTLIILSRQPKAEADVSFKVPLVPLLPCVSILMNFYLMVKLDLHTWIRFTVWLVIGMLIYVFYSVSNSVEGKRATLQDQGQTKPYADPTSDKRRTCNNV